MTDIFACFDELEALSRQGAWIDLDAAFKSVVAETAGGDLAEDIAAIDLTTYRANLREQILMAKKEAESNPVEGLLFRYELAANWPGKMHVCANYEEFQGDEEWWALEARAVGAPVELPAFGSIYKQYGSGDDDADMAVMIYLVGRTVAALGQAATSDGVDLSGLALCAAYTGQEPFTRIRERKTISGEFSALNLPPATLSPKDLAEDSIGAPPALDDLI